jgi:hypothetical protein
VFRRAISSPKIQKCPLGNSGHRVVRQQTTNVELMSNLSLGYIPLLEPPTNLSCHALKTAPTIAPLFYLAPRLQVSPTRKLVGEWQSGLQTLSGCAQSKLRLSFAALSAKLTTNNTHEHAIHSGNGNDHLPLRWTDR